MNKRRNKETLQAIEWKFPRNKKHVSQQRVDITFSVMDEEEMLKSKKQSYLQHRLYLYTSIIQVCSFLFLLSYTQNINEIASKLNIVNDNFEKLNTNAESIEKYSKIWLQFQDESVASIRTSNDAF